MNKLSSIGEDVLIDHRAIFKCPYLVSFGSHCAVDAGVYITTQADIESYVNTGPYVTIIGGAESLLIEEDFATIAAGVRISCSG